MESLNQKVGLSWESIVQTGKHRWKQVPAIIMGSELLMYSSPRSFGLHVHEKHGPTRIFASPAWANGLW